MGAEPPHGAPKDRIRSRHAAADGHAAGGDPTLGALGHPHLHFRQTDSTNERARALAIAGAPHGALVTAAEQTAGRGRQGRSWAAPPGSALLCSLVLRDPPPLLPLIAGVAVCDALGGQARVKWPNDVVVERADPEAQTNATHPPILAKLAGILVESRPQESWAVLGIGINVAVSIKELPADLRGRAASLELPRSAIEPTLKRLTDALQRRLADTPVTVLDAWRALDALAGREVSWARGQGLAHGVDDAGRLIVGLPGGAVTTLDAGEVHLGPI
jgi:BirA family biotin operon repressor/biotin-[acetyl-CoA-carboxylase] ligase